jgi:hypothetical protein
MKRGMYTLVWGVIMVLLAVTMSACGGSGGGEGGTTYTCTWEERHTACNSGDYYAWTSECYHFDMEDYVEGYTPQQVCDNHTPASGGPYCSGVGTDFPCCIYKETRNAQLVQGGSCP